MSSMRRILAVLAGLLCAGWLLGVRADTPAPGSAAAPAGVSVVLETLAAGQVTGTIAKPAITLDVEYGTATINAAKLATLDLAEGEATEQRSVTAILTDKSRLSGTIPADTPFVVETTTGETRTFTAGELIQVRLLHPKDSSLITMLIGLITLTLMEIVLGVDNIIFISIQAGRLPEHQRARARSIGLGAALGTRILLLLTLSYILGLSKPIFTLPSMPFFESMDARAVSWRDIILLAGGIFLIGKSVHEMHEKIEDSRHAATGVPRRSHASFLQVIATIAVIDIVFSLDSVITAVGMVDEVPVMITAMVIAMFVMLVFAGPVGRFVDNRPTVKILALSFLILIGVLLVAEGLGQHIDKGYIYFAMAFAVGVEMVNLQFRSSGASRPSAEATLPPGSMA